MNNDHAVLRDLAHQYAAVAADPVQQERRELWADHLSLRPTRPLVNACVGPWDAWMGEMLADDKLGCRDPELRVVERALRWWLLRASWGSDDIIEPWISVGPVHAQGSTPLWGMEIGAHRTHKGGAAKYDEPIRTWEDLARLVPPQHHIDEAASVARWEQVEEILDGIVTVNRFRSPRCFSFNANISSDLGALRGIEPIMMDMVEDPDGLERMLTILRDGILANQNAAEAAGDFCLVCSNNQCMSYCRELPWPKANTPAVRKQLWCHMAAQEFTGVSPEMHERFLLNYQMPIMKEYGLISYGCCEDLTHKITILRKIPNLRIIAVTPFADLARCAAQIGTDYVLSWRPSPVDTVSADWNVQRVRRILSDGLAATKGTY
ncbi:MAG: hypothetical protein WCI73_12990, partial [Phycisphaerae bacterium]